MRIFIALTVFIFTNILFSQSKIDEKKRKYIDSLETIYVTNCAEKYNYNYQMKEWQKCLDDGIKVDSTIAYFWQQKAMPYFKVKKYELGMTYINKAVYYNAERWQPYRAFIKCIFQKSYREAINDFEDCKKKWGNQYVMDHTFNFYIALCYLQLNEFYKAEKLLKEYIDDILKKRGKDWEHPTVLFYYGISLYEQNKFQDAIVVFDRAITIYNNFSDAKYYKSICLARVGKQENSNIMFSEARDDAKQGYTINEDNIIYEVYPYQIKWK